MNLAGKVLQNRYAVEKQIGEGGMGTVYVATDKRFGSTVAIKETLFTDPNLLRAFEREAQLLNSLRHPALPRVSDHFAEENGAFIVMEYIAGEDLSAMVERDGAFAVKDVLRWADVLLDALSYLHSQKTPVIHRDIKPQNLKLTPRGEIILLDFGLAKGSASELTQASIAKSVFGYSRSYAPLEQIQGTGTNPCSDLYGLAATLYHLLTGKPPVDALTRATAVLNADSDPLQPAHILNPKIPVAVSSVLHQAMALNSNLRPATAAKMRVALTDAANNQATEEFFDGATIVRAPEVFTQSTQLMGAGGTQNLEDNGATKINPAQNLTSPQKAQNTTNPEQPSLAVPQGFYGAQNRRRFVSPVGIAATIIVVGGAGFAAFYAVNSNTSNPTPIQSLSVQPTKAEAKSEQPETNINSANPVAQASPVVEHQVPENQMAEKEKVGTAPVLKSNDSVKNTAPAPKVPQTPSVVLVQPPDVEGIDKETLQKELEEANKEIEAAMKDVGKRGDFKNIPPEIRSNDPRRPVDEEKLKIYIKRQVEAAKRLQEINRQRAEQGLPPLKPRPQKLRATPRQRDNENDDEN